MTDQPFSEPTPTPAPSEDAPSLARSASIIAFGNVVSRLLGLGRETTIAYFFGASGLVSAFQAASTIPTMIFDLLVGGMLSAALVPVFSDYARAERRREFGQVVGAVLSVIGLAVAGLVVVIMLLAEPLAHLVAGGLPDELVAVTASLLRIMTPAIWFLAISGVVTGALFALKRFTFPAFAAAVYNLGIIVAALLLQERMGIFSLAVGVLLGSVMQLLLQAPDLLRARVVLRAGLRHPALRRIWLLYLPIPFGLLGSQVQVIIDRRLASGTGEQSLAWMRDATTLFQLPHGLVAVAISLAALPSLAQYFAARNEKDFRATLGRGLRTVLLLITPATVGLLVLGTPIVQLIFQRGAFQPEDTAAVTAALNLYLIGLIPASLDWLLNYTFYARNDTLTPAIVGVVSVGIYLVFALLLVKPFGYLGLVFADSMKHTGHFLLMWLLLRRRLGDLSDLQGGVTALRSLAASAVMAVALLLLLVVLRPALPVGLTGNLLLVAVAGGVGSLLYLVVVSRLGVQEAGMVVQRFGRRLRRR
ncbi:MAG TPA: murein biosynthesis integral membrane protein MurJ [Anaerolineae bacterium]|nr:murein biosynthesis integral membrane protein MurJ [Anaerolineae bacterium]